MDIQEKYDDLYNLIQNLEMTIKETNFVEIKNELTDILYWAEDEIKDTEEELMELREMEWKQQDNEQQNDYRTMQGF